MSEVIGSSWRGYTRSHLYFSPCETCKYLADSVA
jgi:hypothetical protein